MPEKASNNPAQDLSPGVPTFGTIKIGQFRGSGAGFGAIRPDRRKYRTFRGLFGDDWDENVSKTVVIPTGLGIGKLIVDGGNGNRTIQVDGEIQGDGGGAAEDGDHALLLIGLPAAES